MKIAVDNLSLPSLFIGNDSQVDKIIEIGYGVHRIYEGIYYCAEMCFYRC